MLPNYSKLSWHCSIPTFFCLCLLQDLAPFSEENFDPKAWINDVFKGQEKKEVSDVNHNVSLKLLLP